MNSLKFNWIVDCFKCRYSGFCLLSSLLLLHGAFLPVFFQVYQPCQYWVRLAHGCNGKQTIPTLCSLLDQWINATCRLVLWAPGRKGEQSCCLGRILQLAYTAEREKILQREGENSELPYFELHWDFSCCYLTRLELKFFPCDYRKAK